jgi:hypothetical protein
MGRLTALTLAFGIVLLPAKLRGEVRPGEYLFGPYGMYSIPVDDYPAPRLSEVPFYDMGSDAESNPGLSGAVDRVMGRNWSLGAEFKIHFGTVDEHVMQDFLDYHVADLDTIKVTWRTIHFGARGRYYMQPEKPLNPYLQGGLGIYVAKQRAEFNQVQGSGSTNDYFRSETFTSPGISFGPGVLVRVTNDTRMSLDVL